jgi:CheY-like chemotaxis protein
MLAGATAYLTKPFTKDSLLLAVRTHALPPPA